MINLCTKKFDSIEPLAKILVFYFSIMQLDPEERNNLNQIVHCPECNSDITFERSPQQIADLMEEARLRLLTAQMVCIFHSVGFLLF